MHSSSEETTSILEIVVEGLLHYLLLAFVKLEVSLDLKTLSIYVLYNHVKLFKFIYSQSLLDINLAMSKAHFS